MFAKYPDVVTVSQLCAMLSIGKNTAYKLVTRNTIPSVKMGRVYKIPKANIVKYLRDKK